MTLFPSASRHSSIRSSGHPNNAGSEMLRLRSDNPHPGPLPRGEGLPTDRVAGTPTVLYTSPVERLRHAASQGPIDPPSPTGRGSGSGCPASHEHPMCSSSVLDLLEAYESPNVTHAAADRRWPLSGNARAVATFGRPRDANTST